MEQRGMDMCPDLEYRVGAEAQWGESGNAPFLFWPVLPYLLSLVLGSLSDIPLRFIPFTPIAIAIWLSMTMMLLIALLIQLLFQLFQRVRYRTIMDDPAVMMLLNRAQDRMSFSRRPEVWKHPGPRPVLLAISNPLCKAILISESAAADILQKQRKGEIILADVMKATQGYRPYLNAILPMLMFIFLSALSVNWGRPYPIGQQLMNASMPFLWIGEIVFIGLILWYGGRPRENRIHLAYGIHPNVARLIVFRGSDVTPHEAQKTIQDSRGPMGHPEKRKKIRAAFMIGAAASIGLVIAIHVWLSVAHPLSHLTILPLSTFLASMLFIALFIGFDIYWEGITNNPCQEQ